MFKSGEIILPFKNNNHFYPLILLFILIPLFSFQDTQTILYKEPYITLIIFGTGSLSTVSSSSFIRPYKIYLTKTNAEISFTPQNNCPIQITDVSEGNNITLLFNENDSDISCLFHSLNNIRKVDFTHFKNRISKIDYIFWNCNNLEEVIMGNLDISSVTNMAGMFQNI